MRSYFKEFFFRGLICGGFGPIVVAIVYLCLHYTIKDFSLTGKEMFFAVLSTYLLAFMHAGASVFWQIEHWHTAKSLFFHFLVLYMAYSLCYLANSWIPFEPMVLVIFTGVFVLVYFVVLAIVVLSLRTLGKRLNASLASQDPANSSKDPTNSL